MISESSIRRILAKRGLRLEMNRGKSRELYGIGYMVIDDRNTVVLGATHYAYDASLDDVAELLAS